MVRDEFKKCYYYDRPTLTDDERNNIINDSLDSCSDTTKYIVTMEELAELQKEISKFARGEGNFLDLVQEMADVYICLYYIKRMLIIPDDTLQKAMDVKLVQEQKRLAKERGRNE